MNADDFRAAHREMGMSRAEMCRRLGLSPNTGTAYAIGRADIPTYIDLAVQWLQHQALSR